MRSENEVPKGKKQCPECKAYVGPRLATCECGHAFTFKTGKEPKAKRVRTAELAVPSDEPAELSIDPSEVVSVNDRKALDSFIKQIKDCRDSAKGGGVYSAFLHCKSGHVVQIEVQFPIIRR